MCSVLYRTMWYIEILITQYSYNSLNQGTWISRDRIGDPNKSQLIMIVCHVSSDDTHPPTKMNLWCQSGISMMSPPLDFLMHCKNSIVSSKKSSIFIIYPLGSWLGDDGLTPHTHLVFGKLWWPQRPTSLSPLLWCPTHDLLKQLDLGQGFRSPIAWYIWFVNQ